MLGYMQTAKRWSILFDQGETDLKTLSGDLLKQVHDLKYLGSWIADSKKDMEV